MKLIELNNISDKLSWDISDDVYDVLVHTELDKDSYKDDSWQSKLTLKAYEKIEVVKIFNGAYANAVCNFSALFIENIFLWKEYTKKIWNECYHKLFYEDRDEYIYELIKSLDDALCGCYSEESCKRFFEVLEKCK